MKIELMTLFFASALLGGSLLLSGCGSDPASSTPSTNAGTTSDAQTPPAGGDAEVTAWLAKGDYKAWKCEADVHSGRPPSPHGRNRVCSNALISGHGTGEFPVGAAGVKEIYDAAGSTITGYAVYRKVKAGGGESWYWYEKLGGSLIANGLGESGTPKETCVGCHTRAGTGSNSGHDFVYTQVK